MAARPGPALLPALLLLISQLALAQTHYRLTPVRPFYGPAGMNDLGQIVGVTIPEGPQGLPQPAIWTPGSKQAPTLLGRPYDSANGINDAGQVAGAHRLSATVEHAVVFSGGGFQDLGTLGGRSSTGYAINESGQVAGFAAAASNQQHAFLYGGGRMQDLGTLPGGGWSYAYGLNDRGDVVGAATVAPGHDARRHPFLFSGGTMTDLGRFAAEDGSANAINNAGQIAGTSRLGNEESRGFFWENGVTTYIGLEGALSSSASSINDKGDVVGSSTLSTTMAHGFIYTDGKTIDLNTLLDTDQGWTIDSAWLINEAGQISGMACRPHPDVPNAGDCASYLMTPVPEPPAWALWAYAAVFGLAIHGIAGRHRWR